MARFGKDKAFKLEIDPSLDVVFDEGTGSSFLAMRRLRWSEDSEFKIDLRKWFTNAEGEEIAGKGWSFITEEGPDNLVQCLLSNGFGDTRKTLEGLQDRDDFVPETMRILSQKGALPEGIYKEEESDDGLFYDPKEFIGE